MAKDQHPGVEFSRPVACDRLAKGGHALDVEASEAECAALADRLGIVSIGRLAAHLVLSRSPAGLIRLHGKLDAEVVQTCVVTLKPVPDRVEEALELFFAEDPRASDDADAVPPFEDQEWPEPIADGRIDVGEAVAQALALALAPYPRAAGAMFEAAAEPGEVAQGRQRPFVEIANLGLARPNPHRHR